MAVWHDPSIYKVQISNACSFSVAFTFTTCGTYFHIYSVLICVHMEKIGGFWSTVVICLFVTLFFSLIYLKYVITGCFFILLRNKQQSSILCSLFITNCIDFYSFILCSSLISTSSFPYPCPSPNYSFRCTPADHVVFFTML